MTLTQGQILNNRYRIEKLLGQGGFGAVYSAWDSNLEAPVAIKECFDISPQAQKQFKLEAQLLFKLHHANLPRVHDHFIIPNQGQYLVMDFVEGQDLGEMLKSGPIPESKVLPWISQVCDALNYLHSQNPPVIHRDIKPNNIRITPQGKAMLVDFGISKIYDPDLSTTLGARAITPGYSPPEQYGKSATDIRSDLYALGATLYHLLTGKLPPDSVDILTHNAQPPSSVIDLNAAISQAVAEAITKAMALQKDERWANVLEFKQAITTKPSSPSMKDDTILAATQVVPTPPSSVIVPKEIGFSIFGYKLPRNQVRVLIAIGLVLVMIMAIAIGFLLRYSQETASEFPAKHTNEITPSLSNRIVDFTDEYGIEMRLIPAGEFQMGSDSGDSDEKPIHTVYIDAFYIDIYEVTNTAYSMCVKAGICNEPKGTDSYSRDSYYGNSDYNDYPVIFIEWIQARDYCKWRGARLPTEAEWEKASRGGLERKVFPWGDQQSDCSLLNFGGVEGCVGDTSKVGSYIPNGLGLFDMAGNVWEWVSDWYSADYYRSSPFENPLGPESASVHILRGGSWLEVVRNVRVSNRLKFDPNTGSNSTIGFRCARNSSIPLSPITESPLPSTSQAPPTPTTLVSNATDTNVPIAILPLNFIDEQGVQMNLIPASEFLMGSDEGESDEKPVHKVYINDFYIDIYEVINSMYIKCVEAGICAEPVYDTSPTRTSYFGSSLFENYPVIYVNWKQARNYCEWRGARLPTEAEWEKAARGGLEGKLYPWGDRNPDCSNVNYSECNRDTVKVGSYPPNSFGLFDMVGNVWEWVWDLYSDSYYASSPSSNPFGPSSGTSRCFRGSSYSLDEFYLRVANRGWDNPNVTSELIGFRCARSADTIPTSTPSP